MQTHHKSRRPGGPPKLEKAGSAFCLHLDFRLVASRTETGSFCPFKPPMLGNFQSTGPSLHRGAGEELDGAPC